MVREVLRPYFKFADNSMVAFKKEPKKAKIPDHVAQYQKLNKKSKQMISTTERHHRQAYDHAVGKLLMKDGYVRMEDLDDKKVQKAFAKEMSDFYISKAKAQFKVGKGAKFDKLEEQLLMTAYAGTTENELHQHTRSLGKGFTFDKFYNDKEFRPEMMRNIKQSLTMAAGGHFTSDHIDDIVKYTGSDKFLDSSKMELGDALNVLTEYEIQGAVLKKQHEKKRYFKK